MNIIHRKDGINTIRLSRRFWCANRLIGMVDAWRCKIMGRHTTTNGDWGYGMKGIVDLYCPNCMQIVKRVPLDDFDLNKDVLDIPDMVR